MSVPWVQGCQAEINGTGVSDGKGSAAQELRVKAYFSKDADQRPQVMLVLSEAVPAVDSEG